MFNKDELTIVKNCLFKILRPRYISINGPNEKEIAYAPLNLFEEDEYMDDYEIITTQSALKKVIEELKRHGS